MTDVVDCCVSHLAKLLELVKRKPKIGRNPGNPKAGQYLIPARTMVRFRVGKDLFNRLNPE